MSTINRLDSDRNCFTSSSPETGDQASAKGHRGAAPHLSKGPSCSQLLAALRGRSTPAWRHNSVSGYEHGARPPRDGRPGSGGSAWESNPAPPRQRGATGFEDREGHRAPFASMRVPIIARRRTSASLVSTEEDTKCMMALVLSRRRGRGVKEP